MTETQAVERLSEAELDALEDYRARQSWGEMPVRNDTLRRLITQARSSEGAEPVNIGRNITFIPESEESNAVISPEASDGPYWTLIAQGGPDEQNAIATEIVRRLNLSPQPQGGGEDPRLTEARREALDLARWLHKHFYSEVTDWKPFDEPASIISQIDNMVAGLAQRLEAALTSPKAPVEGEECKTCVGTGWVEAPEGNRSDPATWSKPCPDCALSTPSPRVSVDEIAEALRPFAVVADEYAPQEGDAFEVWVDAGPDRLIRGSFKLANYRRARAILARLSAQEGEGQ